MKNMFIASLALVLFVATFAACQNTPPTDTIHAEEVRYSCPMHPDIAGKATDKCSKCGMALEMMKNPAAAPKLDTTQALQMAATEPITEQSVNPFTNLYASYFNLKNALAKDDSKGAQAAAQTLLGELDSVQMNQLTPGQHAVWMDNQKQLNADATQISGSGKIKQQRECFVSLSKSMYEVMKVVKNDAPVYYQNCPMYKGGKGANWLSLDAKINNPYFGKEMQTCGKTIETIR